MEISEVNGQDYVERMVRHPVAGNVLQGCGPDGADFYLGVCVPPILFSIAADRTHNSEIKISPGS